MDKKLTYVFGHKNPDSDSVCAAISLSYLKNELGYNTKAAILGNVNPETKYALDYFVVNCANTRRPRRQCLFFLHRVLRNYMHFAKKPYGTKKVIEVGIVIVLADS